MGLRFEALATDYDGTLARNGKVEKATLEALERLRASDRRLFMVTGREVEDLRLVFTRFDLFDVVVAENGAVLYYPSNQQTKLLHTAPPLRFVEELRARGVTPVSVGEVIVASREPNQHVILQTIKELGLELEIIFNKGAVMVLPTGVNKATGLAVALRERAISPHRTVGIGDAENDHAFLRLCGCGVAVNNALQSLKETADLVTRASHGAGVAEVTDLLIVTDFNEVELRRRRQVLLHQDPRVLSGLGPEAGETP